MAVDINQIYDEAKQQYAGREMLGKVGRDEVRAATKTLQDYKTGKQALEARIIENARLYQMLHWRAKRNGKRQTGGLFQACVNKHADFKDNKPEVTVFAQEKSDEETAKAINAALPAILEHGGWTDTYDATTHDKICYGCGITAVTWDPGAERGMGGIVYKRVNPLNIWWDNAVADIQQSRNVFVCTLVSHDELLDAYPDKPELKNLGTPSLTVNRFFTNDAINTSDKSYVVDWYYKKRVNGKTVLHYCKYVEDIVLYATENDPEYAERGWYDHGQYPFVFDDFFREEDSIYGFGLIDANIDAQEDIDELNAAITRNVKQGSVPRYFSRTEGAVNQDEYADFSKDFVHVAQGAIGEESIRQITPTQLPVHAMNLLESKKNDLKETSFNRDVNAGGTGGTQTAAGIAALQESGSKSSRDAIENTYQAFKKICELTIELVRQFYDERRVFRITGENDINEYVGIDNSMMKAPAVPAAFGLDLANKEPQFDLVVKVSKRNAYSRAAQNQDALSLYSMGFFAPQRATESLSALEVMELDNKDKLKQIIKGNSMQAKFNAEILPQLINAVMRFDPMLAQSAMQAAQAAGIMEAPTQSVNTAPGGYAPEMADTDVNGAAARSNAYMEKQREAAAAKTSPV